MEGDPDEASSRLHAALAAWSRLLGSDHVVAEGTQLEKRAATTLPRAPRPLAILRPQTLTEVVGAVKIAGEHLIPLYPISTGRNWGYGDACPVTEGQVLLDLGRMNRIIEVNEELAYAVVEPGVTQGQLAEQLRASGARLWIDCTGAGPDTSIVGNVMERGFGHTAYGNRSENICGMQVVLADGRVLETGFGHYANAKAARLCANGLGPSLDGLFTQSNFGVVTRLGIWLMPAPERVELIVCVLDRHDDISPVVDALRRLRLAGTLRSIAHIGNDLRVISSTTGYPWDEAGSSGLSDAVRARLRRDAGVGAWALSASLAGGRHEVRAARRTLLRALKGPGRKLMVLTRARLDLANAALRPLGFSWARSLRRRFATARSALELNSGSPTRQFLAGAYWRRRGGQPDGVPDPAADGCGLIWLAPVLPMEGTGVLAFCRLIEPIYQRHGFEPMITLSTITDRALGAIMTIAYDREDPEETRRAELCHDSLHEGARGGGLYPVSRRNSVDGRAQPRVRGVLGCRRCYQGCARPARHHCARARRAKARSAVGVIAGTAGYLKRKAGIEFDARSMWPG